MRLYFCPRRKGGECELNGALDLLYLPILPLSSPSTLSYSSDRALETGKHRFAQNGAIPDTLETRLSFCILDPT